MTFHLFNHELKKLSVYSSHLSFDMMGLRSQYLI